MIINSNHLNFLILANWPIMDITRRKRPYIRQRESERVRERERERESERGRKRERERKREGLLKNSVKKNKQFIIL